MSFQLAVNEHFPGALDQREYLSITSFALQRAGFTSDNTLVAVSRCRDEVAGTLTRQLEKVWGPVFELAGLSGMVSAGTSGLSAALAHRRQQKDQSFFVVYAMSHVGIDEDGTVGQLRRPELDQPVPTCGSLTAAIASLGAARRPGNKLDLFDAEQQRVVHRLVSMAGGVALPHDLAWLSKLALRCIEDDISTIFDRLVGRKGRAPLGIDGALFTGVQVHGRYDRTLIWPSVAEIDVDGNLTQVLDGERRSAGGPRRRPTNQDREPRARSATWPARRPRSARR
jgi:hypothetical protein